MSGPALLILRLEMAASSDVAGGSKAAASKRGTGGLGFLAAKIKKVMQKDDDVGRISATVPFMLAKSVELLLKKICDRSGEIAKERGASQLTSAQIKACINEDQTLDFLKDIVSSAPDLGAEGQEVAKGKKRASRPRSKKEGPAAKKGKGIDGEEHVDNDDDDEPIGSGGQEPAPHLAEPPLAPPLDVKATPLDVKEADPSFEDVKEADPSFEDAAAAAAAAVFEALEGLEDVSMPAQEDQAEDDYDE